MPEVADLPPVSPATSTIEHPPVRAPFFERRTPEGPLDHPYVVAIAWQWWGREYSAACIAYFRNLVLKMRTVFPLWQGIAFPREYHR